MPWGSRRNGFIILPRHHQRGKRYPAIIVTHGDDADQRFGTNELEWNYPIHLFAERGYIVLLVNDPPPSQSAAMMEAFTTWNNCDGHVPPRDLQHLNWLNAIESYRALIAKLSHEGVIDATRVGIAGYSAGSQMVNVAVTQTHLFAAASSGDGEYLEPAINRTLQCSYRAVYGGAPGDPAAIPNYQALAPSYRARYSSAAVLQQLAVPRPGSIDFYQALRVAHVPAAISLYPGETPAASETHLFHIPSNQRAAMIENLNWFDFWLRDKNPQMNESELSKWKAMRAEQKAHPVHLAPSLSQPPYN